VHVHAGEGSLSASVRLDQTDGHADLGATGALAWGAELAPQIDPLRTIDVTLRAQNFRVRALKPFVPGGISELDGRIDADARVRIERGGEEGQMIGAVTLRDGVLDMAQIGERFHGVRGRVIMKPWGTLRFEDFSAAAPTGRLTASAEAVLAGLHLRSAVARVHLAGGESLPLSLDGVPLGRARGDVTARARMSPDGKRLDVDVDIPTLQDDLPQSTGHAVQSLEPDRTVRVGVHTGSDFVTLPLGPPQEPRAPSDLLVVHATIKLGSDVEVRRAPGVRVAFGGQVVVEVSDKAHVSGRINLERGQIEIQGKMFHIDHGTVSFVGGDPADPLIIAAAYWDAPDGTRVHADFSGHVSSGKLSLRAEPTLSEDAILSLLLFGSPDGSFGAETLPGQQESAGIRAASLAGGIVAQGLNKAISGLTSADITTRVDTSRAESPRPELAVQVSRSVSARLGYRLGVPAPGDNPDRTELTLEWRFIRNWSLVIVIGDQGSTAVETVWRLRY